MSTTEKAPATTGRFSNALLPGRFSRRSDTYVQHLWAATYGDVLIGDRLRTEAGAWSPVKNIADVDGGRRRLRLIDDRDGKPFERTQTVDADQPAYGGGLVRPVDDLEWLRSMARVSTAAGTVEDRGELIAVCTLCREPVSVAITVDDARLCRVSPDRRLRWALIAHITAWCAGQAEYAWIVDKDYGSEPDEPLNRVGTAGPGRAPSQLLRRLEMGQGKRWRTLYDGDEPLSERLVHAGRYLDWYDLGVRDVDSGVDFGPLTDLSQLDCGAAFIQYLEHGTWATL